MLTTLTTMLLATTLLAPKSTYAITSEQPVPRSAEIRPTLIMARTEAVSNFAFNPLRDRQYMAREWMNSKRDWNEKEHPEVNGPTKPGTQIEDQHGLNRTVVVD